jgi:5-methylcytosine-specific restriction endonuclease McrA
MKKLLIGLAFVATAVSAQTLPNPKLTPGKADPALTKSVICSPSFRTSTIRNVPESTKKQVYSIYLSKNYEGRCAGVEGCEVDHLISLELGGSNDIQNLWPESYSGTNSAHTKDKLENTLHSMVCKGQISLEQAQKEISTDWISAYGKYVK